MSNSSLRSSSASGPQVAISADDELQVAWRYGDAANNVLAMLRHYERKRDETPWWKFWARWEYHDSVRSVERARDRIMPCEAKPGEAEGRASQ